MPIILLVLILILASCSSTETKLSDLCDTVGAQRGGHSDGHEGRPAVFPEEMFRNCDNRAEIRTAYLRGHSLGMNEYCGEDHIRAMGLAMGESGQDPLFEEARFSACGKEKSLALKGVYLQGHQQGLATLCEAPRAGQAGFRDGSEGRPQDALGEKYRLCRADRRKKIYANYEREYARGLSEWKAAKASETGKSTRHAPHAPHFPPHMNYPRSVAREACRKAGHSESACDAVTSIACIETGHSPVECDIQTSYIAAVDACIRRGHRPSACASVKDRACIEAGRELANCQTSPQ